MASAIESHPKAKEVIEGLVSGSLTIAGAARIVGITPQAVGNFYHKRIVPMRQSAAKLQAVNALEQLAEGAKNLPSSIATVARGVVESAPYILRTQSRQAQKDDLFRHAHQKKDLKGYSTLLREDREDMRFMAELQGLLSAGGVAAGQNITVNGVVVIMPEAAPSTSELSEQVIDVTSEQA